MNLDMLWQFLNMGKEYGMAKVKDAPDQNMKLSQICVFLLTDPDSSQVDIADALGMTTATVARYLQKLEENHFVTRTADPQNRRVNLVRLTEPGREYARRVLQAESEWKDYVSSRLTQDENREFDRLCEKMLLGAQDALHSCRRGD